MYESLITPPPATATPSPAGSKLSAGMAPVSYKDPVWDSAEQDASTKTGVPAGVLRIIRTVGERSNGNQVSPKNAQGVYQFIPSTRDAFLKKYGVDAYSNDANEQALAAAYHLKESYERTGSWDKAMAGYNGGVSAERGTNNTDENKSYAARTSAALRGDGKRENQDQSTNAPYFTPSTGGFASLITPPAPSRTALEATKDVALGAGAGVVQGVEMLAGAFGADNPVARGANEVAQSMVDMQSPARKQQRQRRAELIQEAETSGSTWNEIVANVGAFIDAPVESSLNAIGTSVPTLLATLIPGVGQAGAARLVLQGAIGAAQGAGAVKGSIYEAVERELSKPGPGALSPDDAKKAAAAAQAYDGANGGDIALGALLGFAAGQTGIEASLSRILSKEGADAAAAGMFKRAALGVAGEAPMEGLQGGQERLAANRALQNEGVDVPTWQGVAGQAAGEAAASVVPGGVFGAMTPSKPALPPELQPVAEKADEPNSPLSKAAMAANTPEVIAQREADRQAAEPSAAAPTAGTAQRLAELESINKDAEEGQGRFFTPEERAEYEQLIEARDATPGAKPKDADVIGDRAREIAATIRDSGALEALRSPDSPVKATDLVKDLATAQSPNTPAAAREQALGRVEFALEWAGLDLAPRATQASQSSSEVSGQVASEAATQVDPVIAAMSDPKVSDADKVALRDAYNTALNTRLPQATRDQALAQAREIAGRYAAPAAAPASAQTPAVLGPISGTPGTLLSQAERMEDGAFEMESNDFPEEARQLRDEADRLREEAASIRAGESGLDLEAVDEADVPAPETQQTVALPTVKSTPAGDGPAYQRRRRASLQQLAENGFTSVKRDGNKFSMINPRTGQVFNLDSAADAQLARKAIADNIAAKAAETNTDPTDGQKSAGNYKKARINFEGLEIAIENPVGSERKGKDDNGEAWSTPMELAHYGYIVGSESADGDGSDIYLLKNPRLGVPVYVIDQYNEDGTFDETKTVLGASSEAEALKVYDAGFSDGSGPSRRGAVTPMSIEEFKTWAFTPEAKKAAGPAPTPKPETTLQEAAAADEMNIGSTMRVNVSPTESVEIGVVSELPGAESVTRGGRAIRTSKRQGEILNAIANAFGKKVVFFYDKNAGKKGGVGDGFIIPSDTNTIYLSAISGRSPVVVFGHELMHQLKRDNPEAHAAISAVVARRMNKQAVETEYGNLGYKNGQVMEELVSDLGGDLMADKAFWADVMAEVRDANGEGAAKKILAQLAEFIYRAIDSITKNLRSYADTGAGSKLVDDMTEIRAAFRDALAQYMQTNGIAKPSMQAEILRAGQEAKRSAQRDMFADDFIGVDATIPTRRVIDSKGNTSNGGNANSLGQQIASTRQSLENFWSWFGDSETVDNSDRPIVYYHTTRNDFDQFEANRVTKNSGTFGDWETTRAAMFFTDSIEDSQAYGTTDGEFRSGANVMPVYLKAENILDMTSGYMPTYGRDAARIEEAGLNPRYMERFDWSKFDDDDGRDMVDALKRAGYDAIKFWDENPDTQESFQALAVFDPNQIKSATGNRGTFDSSDANITRSADRPDSPEFRRWFGDSKVVDANGKPLVMYHGTYGDFDTFKRRTGDIGLHFGDAATANDRIDTAVPHRGNKDGKTLSANVMPVYLSIKNPIRLKDPGFWNAENMKSELLRMFPQDAARIGPAYSSRVGLKSTKDIREFLQSKGYDGVVYKNTGEVPGSAPFRERVAETRAAMDAVFPKGKNSFDQNDQKVPEYKAWSDAERAYREHRENNGTDSYIAFEPNQIKSAIGNSGEFSRKDKSIVRSADRPDALTVEGYHFSKASRPVLNSVMYGTGLQGSDRDAIQRHPDERLRQRISFYVDKGTGVRPESGVGGYAHRATLSNIYDSNADPKRLKQGNDKRAFESAVLDAGYDGYLDRLEGTQPGQVIMLGRRSIKTEQLGPRSSISDAKKVPPPAARKMDAADRIMANKSLPSGKISPQRWGNILRATMPEEYAQLESSGLFDGDGEIYKDQLVASARKAQPVAAQSKDRETKIEKLVPVAQRGQRVVGQRVTLSAEEKQAIEFSAETTGVSAREITRVVREHKLAHPTSQGWAQLNFAKAKIEKGKISYEYGKVPYSFNADADGRALKPGTAEYDRRVAAVARRMTDEVRRVHQRATDGDKNAENILAQAGWYKSMRARLRHEFGGLGDLFADLLGATSPNTPVRENWANAVDSLRRATRGDFDQLIPAWEAWADDIDARETELRAWFNGQMADGKSKKAIKESAEYKEKLDVLIAARELPDALLPTRETGKKYGFNGRNVARAMVDLWRVVRDADPDVRRGGTAPKAVNFSGNLIGFRDRATIDVWAARMLQRLSGGLRVPSMAEVGVSGELRADGTTTLQFGFGQDVFSGAVKRIRKDPELKTSDTLAKISDDDLQAVVWFIEKEIWTANNWTNAAGEGGSFELEASLSGSAEQERIKELRRIIDSSKTKPDAKAKARTELAKLERTVDRFVGGLSTQMSMDTQGIDFVPQDSDMARLSNEVTTAIYEDESATAVLASKALATEGRYGGIERSLDLEVVAREGYKPAALWKKMLEIADRAKQDSTFLSRVLRDNEEPDMLRHRPGVEIYFREAASREKLEQVLGELSNEGVEFLTVIVDGRRMSDAVKGQMPPAVGVRMQYVPEFDQRYGFDDLSSLDDAALAAKIQEKADEMSAIAERVAESVGNVSFASQFWYETDVAFSHEYQEKSNAVATGTAEGSAQEVRSQEWVGQPIRRGLESANRQARETARTQPGGDVLGRDQGGAAGAGRPDAAGGADSGSVQDPGGIRRSARRMALEGGQDQRIEGREEDGSLTGLPRDFNVAGQQIRASHWAPAEAVARKYMVDAGLEYTPPVRYAKVDPERAKRIAAEYDKLKHDPQNPQVKAAYEALARETIAQYRAVIDSGLQVEFIDFAKQGDPYAASPRLMTEDVRNNSHMWLFSTRDGFGSDAEFDPIDNPLLAETEFTISGQKALVNDLFRVVHDYFGHVKEGVGFRADGEENTWRAHSSMFSPLAQRALTTETRGQNSWVNYGPHGEANRKAGAAETHYADQKVGLLPQWISEEGRRDSMPAEYNQRIDALKELIACLGK